MSLITNIIIHCSDSRWGCARAIRQWHQQKGWKDIGYHFVILNGQFGPGFYVEAANGSIEAGRYLDQDNMLDENEVGAHALGYNGNSVGICLVGKETFTGAQMESLASLVRELQRKYNVPTTNVLGHRDTASGKKEGKTCPNFDVIKWREASLR
jgi:N-acetylmuramoyl-L-alanine amidase